MRKKNTSTSPAMIITNAATIGSTIAFAPYWKLYNVGSQNNVLK
jgi:hypothetical protein